MLNDIKQDAQTRMTKSIDALRQNLVKVRTGRATAGGGHHPGQCYGGDRRSRRWPACRSPTPARC
jgi:hypothetical protein